MKTQTDKIYTLEIYHTRRGSRTTSGTLEELTSYFGYTLFIGVTHNPCIKLKPKTIKSLISNVNKAMAIKEAACYERTDVSLVK